MRLEWIIEAKDVARVHALMARMARNAFVVHRRKNLEARPGTGFSNRMFSGALGRAEAPPCARWASRPMTCTR